MIWEELSEIKNTDSDLRKFGWVMAGALGAIGGFLLWKQNGVGWILLGLAAGFGAAGLVLPRALKAVHKAWMALALVLGWVMTRVILSMLFFGVITPLGLLMRLFARDALAVESGRKDSYWVPHQKSSGYENQF